VQAAQLADEVLVTADEVGTTALALEEAAAEETALALEEATAEDLTALDEATTALVEVEGAAGVGLTGAGAVLQPQPKPKMQKVRLSKA